MKNMNQTQTRSLRKKVLSLILAVVMAVSLLPISAFASGDSKARTTGGTDYYKILHLDCGRKYFSKDWIIALLNEMKSDGYNQLQLAFGNDGLRFLLNDMSFTANGTTYSHETVVSKVEAGNKLQNSSGDASWLTQTEMDEIIAAADKLHIEIVPLLNLPGHANAILDIVNNNMYNAKIYGTVSQNTLDVTNDAACNFGYEIFKKYVDYFSSKGCKYFNFGADEYGNDIGDGNPHFDVLKGTGYENLSTFINKLAAYIGSKNMTPRTFNDALYYKKGSWDMQTTTNTAIKTIQCCYWSSGWGSYPVAEASTIVSNGHAMINTNGAYYYVLGKDDAFTPGETKVHDAGQYTAAAKFDNTAFASGTVNNPVGSMFCIWSDFPNAETETQVAQNVRLVMRAMALRMDGESIDRMDTSVVANGFNADGTLNRAATGGDNTYTSEVDINLTVGQPSDVYTQAGDVTGKVNKDGFNETVASIDSLEYANVEGKTERVIGTKQSSFSTSGTTGVITDAAGHYMVIDSSGNITSTGDINAATVFTVKSSGRYSSTYSIQGNGYYLQLTSSGIVANSKSGSSFNYAEYNGFYVSGDYYYYRINYSNGNWGAARTTNGDYTGAGQLYSYTESTTPATNATQITFKGNAVGETSVIIGSVKYNIIVSDKALDDALTADTITLEHWITNARVAATSGATGDDRNVQKISKTTDGIQSVDGVAVETLAYVPGYWDKTAVHYWQAVRLDKDHLQTTDGGSDQTDKGTTLTHIRYYYGAWQYETTDGVWHYFLSTDKFVIYYLQKTEVTKEVDTYVKDWGFDTDKTTEDWSEGKGQVALTFAVVYPDGTVSPAEGDMYKNSTTIFNYWDGRDIGIVAPKNNSDYNIAKITVTDGKRDSNSYSNVWYTTDTITWNKKTNVAGEKWYDETEVWNKSSGTTPMVNGKTSNITWSAKNTAKLVLIYLEPIEKETNLNVQYIDLNANNYVFHSYQVAMKYNQSDDVPTFTKALMLGNTVIGDKGPWNSNVVGNANYLSDEAYVTNSSNTKQTFKKDITTIPEINGIYASGLYKYVKADISKDGKTLRLYYDLNATEGKTFVVDFGLPVEIPFSDFGIKNVSGVTVSFNEQNTAMTERQGTYGNGKIDMTAETVTYTLTKTLDAKIPIPVYVADESGKVQMLSVNVIPATSVYYEDSFATFTNADGTKNVAQGDNAAKGIWTKVTDGTTQTNVNQALEALGGTTNTKNVYGYDPAYADSSKFSMGSATKVTVAADTYKEGKTQWPTATFTFKGTGFDVISLTDNTSGAIFVDVYKGTATSGDSVKSYAVNNYYSYKQNENGQWDVSKDGNNALYQIPVMKVSGLDYGEYTAVIRVAYSSFFDQTTKNEYNFWLDAIRVYDPMGKDNATYGQDKEGYPQYIKLRDSLVGGTATAKDGSVFIDGADKATIDQYKNGGPNNEVYLAYGQAISFTVAENKDIATIQIGAKAPNGTANMTVNNTEAVNGGISTATEMYYKLDVQPGQQVTISNTGDGILSLTNLKITFNSKPNTTVTLAALSDEDQANAVAQVRALFAAPAEPFNPDRFDASWSRNVRKGETAKLTVKTSEDVEAITVNGETIDSFTERHERTGWGWWAKTVTYREFIYTTTADVTRDYTVCAVNAAGVRSEEKTATLTVRPSVRDWLHGIFGKWF